MTNITNEQVRHSWRVNQEVFAERLGQITEKGYDAAHDDRHAEGELVLAGAFYALNAVYGEDYGLPIPWPFESGAFKPRSPREDLVRAGALIMAEIERLDRASETAND